MLISIFCVRYLGISKYATANGNAEKNPQDLFLNVDSVVATNRTIWEVIPHSYTSRDKKTIATFMLYAFNKYPLASYSNSKLDSITKSSVVAKIKSHSKASALIFTSSVIGYSPPFSFPPQLSSFNVRAPFGDGDVVMITHNSTHAFARCPECKPNLNVQPGKTVVAAKRIGYHFSEFWIAEYVNNTQLGISYHLSVKAKEQHSPPVLLILNDQQTFGMF